MGTVVDAMGAPIIGANVLEVGTTNGTITDVNGRFTLDVSSGAKLKISYIGFDDQIVTVGTQREMQIKMKENSEALDEVVVVGYGTQKKVNLTGSVATIKADKLVNRTSSNVVNMLAGQMPGVTVIQNSGQPGADEGVLRVRGLGTMGNASAMVIVDGVESTMSSVNPNDIESIS
ncbi:carboxypeptidase-like regulatory domain-containing protein, partial [Phocaeicola barnesiae]|uniref:carboxypeptidase-like regulatory domain-containing protein n=1 Tax=Phocaeicola barnesiae TaxID=376804 RepID=UPI00241D3296